MGQLNVKQPFILGPESRILTLVIHGIPGSFLEQEHRQTSHKEFHQPVARLRPAIRNRLEFVVEGGEMMIHGFAQPEQQVPSLLPESVATFFSLARVFSLTRALLLALLVMLLRLLST
jgi:hypothetical protein